jgi:uncharacterized protein
MTMTRRSLIRWWFYLCAALMLGAGSLSAQDAAQRIRDRLPEIDALKAAGVLGENNRGLVEARTRVNEGQEALIEAENADRRELYQLVARRSGQTVEEVGQQRAVRIAQQALPGVWLQNKRGDWFQKS